jgi:hypothetical protein
VSLTYRTGAVLGQSMINPGVKAHTRHIECSGDGRGARDQSNRKDSDEIKAGSPHKHPTRHTAQVLMRWNIKHELICSMSPLALLISR